MKTRAHLYREQVERVVGKIPLTQGQLDEIIERAEHGQEFDDLTVMALVLTIEHHAFLHSTKEDR